MRVLNGREMLQEVKNFSYHILNRMTGQGEHFSFLLLLLFLAAGIFLSAQMKNIWPMVVMVGAFLFEVVFSIMVYQLHIWHYIALCFVLMWCFWVYETNAVITSGTGGRGQLFGKSTLVSRILAEGLLVLLGISMFLMWNSKEESSGFANAWNGLYSDGVHAAEYIREYVGTEAVLLSTDVIEAATVQAYLGREYRFYYAGTGEAVSYADYTQEQSREITYEEFLAWVKERFPDSAAVYLLECPTNCIHEIKEEERAGWELCYQTTEVTARAEEYCLYRIVLQE